MSWDLLKEFRFGHPWWLLALPVIWWWFRRLGGPTETSALLHSSTRLLVPLARARKGGPGRILRTLRLLALLLIVFALARPRLPSGELPDPGKGIDIMLVCDVSGSMGTKDFSLGTKKITRREALLNAISGFVDARKNDRIGMVGFARYTYLLSPLTTDGNWIKEVFKLVELQGGTAIGRGIAAGVDKLITDDPDAKERSKVMILVTDGANNSGESPREAAEYAREKGVRIYVLQITDLRRVRTSVSANALSHVAALTGGQYFQAANTEALVQIYHQIDQMEAKPFESNRATRFHELFPWLLWTALGLLLFEALAARTFWMKLP